MIGVPAPSGVKDRTRIRARIILGLLLVIAGLAGYAWKSKASRELLARLRQRAALAGFVLDFGTVERGWFSSTIHHARLHLGSGTLVTVESIRLSKPPFGETAVAFNAVHCLIRGSLTELFEELGKERKWRDLAITFNHVNVDYEDRLFGRVALKDVIVKRSGSGYLLRAGELSLGSKRWQAVTLSIEKPKVALTIGIGEQVASTAQIQLRYMPTRGIASEWVLDIVSQRLAPLIRRIGVDPGTTFDASRIVGSISIIVPDDPQRKLRGTLALLVDGFIKPHWPDATALIGETGSLGARIEPAADRSSWALTHVEATLPLFSLTGTGKITFGDCSRLAIDVSGARNCAQLRAHMPPSKYLEQVESHLETNSAKSLAKDSGDLALESAELRLQLDLDDFSQGRRNIAWHLTPGCGLKELSEGTLANLTLPRAQARR